MTYWVNLGVDKLLDFIFKVPKMMWDFIWSVFFKIFDPIFSPLKTAFKSVMDGVTKVTKCCRYIIGTVNDVKDKILTTVNKIADI